jgi:CRISPR-associated protein Csx10
LWLAQPRSARGEDAQDEAVFVRVIARAHEPVLIAQRASAGNQFETQSVITGKALRGALAAIVARRFDLTDDATRTAFVDLFLRGDVRFPMLYPMRFEPAMGEIYPAIPVPRDGFKCKVYPGHQIQWGTAVRSGASDPEQVCGQQIGSGQTCDQPVKAVRGKFIGFSHDEEEPFEPDRRNEMHIQIDRDTGRVTEGQVFEYVALEAGQYFCGELRCANAAAWEDLQAFLELDAQESKLKVIQVRLGKGRRRGYGLASLCFEKLEDQLTPWIWQPIEQRVKPDAKELTLTLLTDTIVTDEQGRFVTGFEASWLRETLNLDVRLVDDQTGTGANQRTYAAMQVVDGFNTVQQLPRWRSVALTAGSTVRLAIGTRPEGDIRRALSEIERDGIGLRRNEGYGQVAFNHPVYRDPLKAANVLVNSLPRDLQPGTGSARSRSQFLQKWEARLRREDWNVCARQALKGAFAALARWLVVEQNRPPADLMKVLDVLLAENEEAREAAREMIPEALIKTLPALGEPDETLKDALIDNYGARDKANKLRKPDARAGVELIRTCLVELSAEPVDLRPFWSGAVALIAAQVSEVTKKKEVA